jgi:glycerol-3-phosphate dehydrogenase subunit C
VACPEHVNVGDLIQKARIQYSTYKPSLRDQMLASTDFVGTMAHSFAPITNFALSLGITKQVLHSVFAIDKHRQFPAYSFQTFEQWFKKHREEQEQYKKHVSYFHGCYANYNYPQLAKDLVKVMNACGYGIRLLEKEKCCGVAMIANGMYKQATKQGEININSMRKAVKRGEPVLTTSSTCTFTMRDEYPHLLEVDNADVRDNLSLATRWLYQQIEAGNIKLAFRKDYHKRFAYHTACHMERMGWAVYSIEMLRMIPGVELTVLDSQCCGIAGTYGFKKENYERSQAIGSGLFKQIREVNPDAVACDCETCKWQIEMSTGYTVKNPISIIADALDVEATRKLNQA